MSYRIWCCDGMEPQTAVVSHTKLTTVEKLGEPGNWTLELDIDDESVEQWRWGHNPTIEVLEPDRPDPAFNGYYGHSEIITLEGGDQVFHVTGTDDLGRLGWRWVAPQSDRQVGFTQEFYRITSQPAGDAASELVENFAGPFAHIQNVLTDFTVAPRAGLGPLTTRSFGHVPLNRQVTALTVPNGLVARCIRQGVGPARTSQFSVTEAQDLTSTVVFHPVFGEVKNFALRESREQANVVKALGAGEGAARLTTVAADPLSARFPDYVHDVIDRSTNDDPAALAQEAAEYLGLSGQHLASTATPATDDRSRLRYGVDFNIGDIVRLEDRLGFADLQITQCTTVYLSDGSINRDYVVGPALLVAFSAIVHELRSLRDDFNQLR